MYVPVKLYTTTTQFAGSQEEVHIEEAKMHRILMGGDLLTAVRGRGAQKIRANGYNPVIRLEGIQPFSLDWHTKMNLLEVSLCINRLIIAIVITYNTLINSFIIIHFSWYGDSSTIRNQLHNMVPSINCAT